MSNTAPVVVNIHSSRTTLEELQVELRIHPSRLEEKEMTHGFTPLISSAFFGNIAVVEFLLSIGANVHAKNKVWMRNLFSPGDQDFIFSNFASNIFLNIVLKRYWFDRFFELHECCVAFDMEKRVSVQFHGVDVILFS